MAGGYRNWAARPVAVVAAASRMRVRRWCGVSPAESARKPIEDEIEPELALVAVVVARLQDMLKRELS
jgi:hypothetical protein